MVLIIVTSSYCNAIGSKLHREGGAPVGTFAEEGGLRPQSPAPPYGPVYDGFMS